MKEPENIESLSWEDGYNDGRKYVRENHTVQENGYVPHLYPEWLRPRATKYECGFPEGLLAERMELMKDTYLKNWNAI